MNYYPNNFYQNYNNQLQGKVVENIDMVKISEIPFGGYGVFPKADLNEVYVKSWNNNGTTNITTYIKNSEEEPKDNQVQLLEERIAALEEQIKQKPKNNIDDKKKEAIINAY